LSPPIGALDSESPFYIIRPEDKNAVAEIKEAKEGVTYTIVGPRQVGKTSLLYRIIDAAVEAQMQVALLDFQQLDLSDLQDSDKFFARFCHVLAHELGIPDRLDEYWNPRLGNLQRCSDYVGNYILRTLDRPLLLAMDEVETLFDSPVRSEFFAMLRVWHNNRAMRMRPLWKRLYIVIVTSTEPHYFIESLNQSPFNVATEVPLRDFIDTEIIELNRRYGLPLTQAQLKRLFSVVGGHPHLIHQSLYLVARGTIAPDKLFVSAIDESHPFFDYLRNLLLRLQKNTQMAKCLREVIDTKQCEDLRLFFRLQSAGLVKREGAKVVIRCQLYENFFREYLHA
jgi:GTPase SAR1 family protein